MGADASPSSILLLITLLKLKTAAKVSDSRPNLPMVLRLISDITHLHTLSFREWPKGIVLFVG